MELHTEFKRITIHTARCDVCNQKNVSILQRCQTCGWSICGPCFERSGSGTSHLINGGDNRWTIERIQPIEHEDRRPRPRGGTVVGPSAEAQAATAVSNVQSTGTTEFQQDHSFAPRQTNSDRDAAINRQTPRPSTINAEQGYGWTQSSSLSRLKPFGSDVETSITGGTHHTTLFKPTRRPQTPETIIQPRARSDTRAMKGWHFESPNPNSLPDVAIASSSKVRHTKSRRKSATESPVAPRLKRLYSDAMFYQDQNGKRKRPGSGSM